MSGAAILDTSWLLELYRVPGHFTKERTPHVLRETGELSDAGSELLVTVPVLFEVAGHITHVSDGTRRRELSERLRDDIRTAIDRESPWTIASVGSDVLLRLQDLMQLAERFLELSGPEYSFADISIIDLKKELQRPGRTVKIKTYDKQLESYSD